MVVQSMLRTYDLGNLRRKKTGFEDSSDVTECLRHLEIPYIPQMGA